MAYKDPVVHINIPADLLTQVRSLPLEQRSASKRVVYLIKLGMRYHAILEKAAANEKS